MYSPKSFQNSEISALTELMRSNPFATIITVNQSQVFPNHLPVLTEIMESGKTVIVGHMARANPQWSHFQTGAEATVIFHGPHTYVTPQWYPDPTDVPTWNYAVVHALGVPKVIEDYDGINSILVRSVQAFEEGEPNPWKFDLPEDMKKNLVRAIVGFEIEVTQIDGKFKLSQNRSESDRQGVLQGLQNRPDEMSKKVRELMLGTKRS